MARFDYYTHRPIAGYLLDVQSPLHANLKTRAVIPLMPLATSAAPVQRLHPIFTIAGSKYLMHTHLIGAVPARELRNPAGHLREHHDDIVAALDALFLGY
jgi:toxin CcdB